MKVGCVKEIKNNEFRVGMTPDNVRAYVDAGHEVYVERDAGVGSGLSTEEYRLGELYVCPDKHLVRVEEQEVTLTHKEFELLCLLLRNPSMVFTRDKLLDLIWCYAFDGESRTVDVHIRNLRQKLGPAGRYIETVRGVGYRIGGAAGEG